MPLRATVEHIVLQKLWINQLSIVREYLSIKIANKKTNRQMKIFALCELRNTTATRKHLAVSLIQDYFSHFRQKYQIFPENS